MLPRPNDVLTPDEVGRSGEFVAIYNDVLSRLNPAEPTSLDHFFAQEVAAILWRIQREGCDGRAVFDQVVRKRFYAESRANALLNMDSRTRVRALAARDFQMLLKVREVLCGSMDRSIGLRVIEGGKTDATG
jgi:hypothetical protein